MSVNSNPTASQQNMKNSLSIFFLNTARFANLTPPKHKFKFQIWSDKSIKKIYEPEACRRSALLYSVMSGRHTCIITFYHCLTFCTVETDIVKHSFTSSKEFCMHLHSTCKITITNVLHMSWLPFSLPWDVVYLLELFLSLWCTRIMKNRLLKLPVVKNS
jgi:hypothetical protein